MRAFLLLLKHDIINYLMLDKKCNGRSIVLFLIPVVGIMLAADAMV